MSTRRSTTRPRPDAVATLRTAGSSALIRSFPEGAVIVFDHDLRFVCVGGVGLTLLGLSWEVLEGRTLFDAFPAPTATELEPKYQLALEGQESAIDVTYDDRTYLVHIAPVRGADGTVIAGISFTQDVTATRGSERVVNEAEQRFRVAFEHAPIGKALIGLDGRYLEVNQAMCDITGYAAEHLQQLTVADITPPEDHVIDMQLADRLVTGELPSYTCEKRFLTATGGSVAVLKSVSLVRHEDGSPAHFIAQIQDVTERKEHDRLLAEERRRLRHAEHVGHVGTWEWEVASDIFTCSDSLIDLYGIASDEVPRTLRALLATFHSDARAAFDAAVKTCVRGGAPLHTRYRLTRRNDKIRWFEARGAVVAEDGYPTRLTGAMVDVTEQVSAEEDVARARDAAVEASRQKSAFLATMSHEIRTPMNAVIGMTDLLLETPLNPDQRDFVETVRSSGELLLGVINDILDFSKIEAGGLILECEPFDLRECAETAVELVSATVSRPGLELIGYVDACCSADVVGDVTRLRQVLVNLLSNAAKFTPEGEVLLRIFPDGAHDDRGRLRVRVTDTGIGIPPASLDGLFQAFSQVDASTTRVYGGTGLGLAISRRLVAAMGGVLQVESEPGVGTSFEFSVELPPASAPTAPASRYALERRSALVLDDNATARGVGRAHLEGWGMTVTEATSGREAIELLQSGTRFDVALLDVDMPDMNGTALPQAIGAIAVNMPLILFSNRGDRVQREEQALFAAVVPKPVKYSKLERIVRCAIDPEESSTAAELPSQADNARPHRRLRILLADDNPVNQMVARLMLEKLGQQVDVVTNGADAAHAAARTSYDIIFMDVQMPDIDGLEASRLIRSETAAGRPKPRIVALTAGVLVEDRDACASAGMDEYLSKPLRLSDLDTALRRAYSSEAINGRAWSYVT